MLSPSSCRKPDSSSKFITGEICLQNINEADSIESFEDRNIGEVKEYELSEVFHHSEDDHHYEVLNTEHLTQNSISVLNNGNSDIETAIEEEIREQEVHQYPPKMRPHLQQFLYTTTSSVGGSMSIPRNSTSSTTTYEDRDANTIKNKDEFTTIISIPDIVPRGNKDAIMNSIVDSYRSHSRDHRRKKYRKPKKIRPPRDCRVSEWSPWSSCSKSCGIGEMQRRREVIKHARRGGRLCPPLLETKWCGSARSCNRGFYQWYD
ncbi:spondin [Holotrichia oblita]|uniref:Spondin n=1 Tax=Holotrichia oblita TaxID=644536 RepID=A0ACB9T020_HOLOL|nr:spondin [Holotrichia oblita]